MIVNLNGVLTAAAAARVDPTDRGLTLGDGLFETMLAQSGKILHLSSHLHRLRTGAHILQLPLLTDIELQARLYTTLAASCLSTAVIRLTITRGPACRGLLPPTYPTPTTLITTTVPPPTPQPVRAVIATVTRRNQNSPLSRIKSLSALDNILACQEAANCGVEEAVLLNVDGRLAETATANLFLVIDGTILTPSVTEGALPGVIRAEVIARMGAIEASLKPDDLFLATEVFLTNAISIRTLTAVNNRQVGGTMRVQYALARNRDSTLYA